MASKTHNATAKKTRITRRNSQGRRRAHVKPGSTSDILRRAHHNVAMLSPADLGQLHRSVGNRAVGRILDANASGKEARVSRKVENSIEGSRGRGQALSPGVRRQMETAFGADFRQVSIHDDRQADGLNNALQAQAFTTGNDIYFRQNTFAPESSGGKRLLAHELAHVVQQTGPSSQVNSGVQRYPIQRSVVGGDKLRPLVGAGPHIQRGFFDAIGSFFKKGVKLVKNAFRFIKNRLFQSCGGKIDAKESKNILEEAFEGRKFKVDRVKVVDEAGIKKAWDDIYGKGSYDGTNGQKADGPLEGFTAPDNTIYINSSLQAVDTMPHEILHRHEDGAVIDKMGENFNEGFTEYLTQKAVKQMGYSPTSSYPDDLAIVKKMVTLIGGDTVLENAYFDGDLATLQKNLDKAKGKGTYTKIVKAMKAGNYATAGKLLE